jgi:hypothetical protein
MVTKEETGVSTFCECGTSPQDSYEFLEKKVKWNC